jgi:hypothetical protein
LPLTSTFAVKSNFRFDSSHDIVLYICGQRNYPLKLLGDGFLRSRRYFTVSYALVLSRSLHALPAWGGFLSLDFNACSNRLP